MAWVTRQERGLNRLLGLSLSSFVAIPLMIAPTHAAPVTNPATGHTYEVIKEGKTWADAQSAALAMSTTLRSCHLATITSQAENDFVVAQLITPLGAAGEDDPDVWIGAERRDPCPAPDTDNASLWGKWVTGEAWSYTNWRPGDEPDPFECDADCVVYGRDKAPISWESEICTEGAGGVEEDELWYLVECDPLKATDPATGHTYQLIKQIKTWDEARSSAAAMSTSGIQCHLATITSQAENDFVVSRFLMRLADDVGEDVWIGGKQRDPCIGGTDNDPSLWGIWVTGEPWVYTNWSPHEPDDDDCPLACLTYGSEDDPPHWESETCTNDEECLVECEPPRRMAPVLSQPAVIVVALLMLLLGWWALNRRRARAG